MNIPDKLADYQQRIDAALEKWLPRHYPHAQRMHEAMRYAVAGGGKRIRPALVYACGEALGVDPARLDGVACAIEAIHTYSLVHDDLPAMDDDDLRRGRPTLHKAFDEATAILAGDALQTLAFEILCNDEQLNVSDRRRLEMVRLLAEATGIAGMAGGQAIDLDSVGKPVELEQLETMHRLKTGALLRASVMLGAMCRSDVRRETLDNLEQYAQCIGLAFQIQDDILDVVADTSTLGKPQGSDMAADKPAYPSLIGIDEARRRAIFEHEKALEHLSGFDERADSLRQLSAYIIERAR